MTETSTIECGIAEFREPFRQYAVDWNTTLVRTDTPNLLGFFAQAAQASADRALAEAYGHEADAELEAAHEDLAEASFRSLSDDE